MTTELDSGSVDSGSLALLTSHVSREGITFPEPLFPHL